MTDASPTDSPRTLNTLRAAGLLLLAGAILHGAVFALTGAALPALLIVAAVFALLGLGLLRGIRMLACLAFVAVLAALPIAVGGLADPALGPGLGHVALLALDLLAGVSLFLHIWRR